MERPKGAQLSVLLGTAHDALDEAVDACREMDSVTGTDRKAINAAMDDLTCQHERVRIAHQRLMERAQAQPMGLPR